MGTGGIGAMVGAGLALSVGQLHVTEVARPPQFVMLAFDNCTELTRWQDLTDFAAATYVRIE